MTGQRMRSTGAEYPIERFLDRVSVCLADGAYNRFQNGQRQRRNFRRKENVGFAINIDQWKQISRRALFQRIWNDKRNHDPGLQRFKKVILYIHQKSGDCGSISRVLVNLEPRHLRSRPTLAAKCLPLRPVDCILQ